MGQLVLRGPNAAAALERLVPGDICGLRAGRIRHTMFTNDAGKILDDLMVTNQGDHLSLVVNAACKAADVAHLTAGIEREYAIEVLADRSLIAVQGPKAAAVLDRILPGVGAMTFMTGREFVHDGRRLSVSRSGYTGEDGFELSIPTDVVVDFVECLLAEPEARPIGLGARDSLRLEAGLCLYGHDIDTTTTPIEAGLDWAVGKRRRAEGGFPGAEVIQREFAHGPMRRRVGLRPEGKVPAREHTEITDGFRLVEHVSETAESALSVGRLKGFHGQMGMFIRALAYMMSHGGDGLHQASSDAVLNANYLLASLQDVMSLPYDGLCMHEVLFDDQFLKDSGISTLDFAKAMIDEGFHPMAMYFPLVVHGAFLMEPTESESKASLDGFIGAVRSLAARAKAGDAAAFHAALVRAPRRRLDETLAARKPVLRWRPDERPGRAAE